MKNLLIYFNPEKKFAGEYEELTKIQIDNSLSLGWNYKDITLVTNFEYEYRGIKSIVVGDGDYEVFDQNKSSKIPIINRLFADGLLEDELYWFHDHDAFQLVPFEMHLEKDAGFTNHGWNKTWNAGSFFFKKEAKDIFLRIWEVMKEKNSNEQNALTDMWQKNTDGLNERWQPINISFNIGIYYIPSNLKRAQLPIKVAHFHPRKKKHLDLFKDLLPERLLKIFKNYGIGEDLDNQSVFVAKNSVDEQIISDLQSIRSSKGKNNWEQFMKKYNCQKIAEIGVHRGVNFGRMITHHPQLAVAIDSWIDDGMRSRNDSDQSQEELDSHYNEFKKNVSDKPYVKILRKYSFEAVKQFEDNFFDLVYIDADHSYKGVIKDIRDWYPKVKEGGFLIGDDYRVSNYRLKFGVIEAVNEFAKENKLEVITLPWYGWALVKQNSQIATDLKNLKVRKGRRFWEPFLTKYHCQRVCELGVFRGENFLEMIKHGPELAVAIDTWRNDGVHTPKDASYPQEELEIQYKDFQKLVQSLPFVKVLRENTAEAANHFPDNYFDFVFVDADHSTEACYQDLVAWYPKVKTRKFLAGHDYRRGFGVVEAVNRFMKEQGLEMIFLPPSTYVLIKK